MTSTCEVLGYLLNGEYFYVISLVSFLVVVALLLAALAYEQLLNIAVNTVSMFVLLFYFSWCRGSRPRAMLLVGRRLTPVKLVIELQLLLVCILSCNARTFIDHERADESRALLLDGGQRRDAVQQVSIVLVCYAGLATSLAAAVDVDTTLPVTPSWCRRSSCMPIVCA
jgi:hypothetical protein